MSLLDFLFPKYCVNCKKLGSYLCADCFAYISFDALPICLVCNRASLDGFTHPGCRGKYTIDGAFSSITYKGVVKKLIYTFKYKPYLLDLQTVLSDFFYEGLIQNESFMRTIEQLNNPPAGEAGETIILVPIPLHSSKLKSRGYNQAEILAKDLSQKLKIPMVNLLKRIKQTNSQVKLKREERVKNVLGAFSVIPPPATPSQAQLAWRAGNIFLVDDVLTTGSTLSEAASTLKRNGAKKVWGLTLAQD